MQIQHQTGPPYYPQANGQVEIFNKIIKRALHKLLQEHPQCYWDDLLPDVKWGLRVLVSGTHGYSPFEMLFKQPAVDGHDVWDLAGQQSISEDAMDGIVSHLVARWNVLKPRIFDRLVLQDAKQCE